MDGMATETPEVDAIVRTIDAICRPGSFLNGEERLFVAQATRSLRNDGVARNPLLPRAVVDTVRMLTLEPASITDSHVFEWDLAGLHKLAYLEIVSVVARMCAIDAWADGMGLPHPRLPRSVDRGFPIAMIDRRARTTTARVPTVGTPGALTALSALPDDSASVDDLAQAFYLELHRVPELDVSPNVPLTRPQAELVAARTSKLNDCFY